MKRKANNLLFAVILAVFMAIVIVGPAVPAFAANLEMLDEMTLGVKVQSQDIILTSEHIDIGAEIGTMDLTNSTTAKNTFYAMGTVTIKGWSIFNLLE